MQDEIKKHSRKDRFRNKFKTSKQKRVQKNCILLFTIFILSVAVCVVYKLLYNGSSSESNNHEMISDVDGTPMIPGADVRYPTVLVDGKLYEWRRGSAIVNAYIKDGSSFLKDTDYYGKIKKTEEKYPKADCELSCLFDVEGKIYTIPNEKYVFLVLNTEWLDDAIVIFDVVE